MHILYTVSIIKLQYMKNILSALQVLWLLFHILSKNLGHSTQKQENPTKVAKVY